MKSLVELLSSAGLTRVQSEILNSALPSIRLRTQAVDETQQELGATHFGGSPDLPPVYHWPERGGTPLPFVAQINVSDLVSYDAARVLPTTGRLVFFFDVDAFFETWPHDPATWLVCYDTSPLSTLQRVALPEAIAKRRRYRLCAVACSTELTLPDYSQYDPTSLQRLRLSQPLTDEEELAYYAVQEQLAERTGATHHTPLHRLLGHPDDVQWDMHDELEGNASDWLLLFQMDSDGLPDTDWGDTGRIYYWIRSRDLAAGDFSQTQVILQST